MDDKYIIEILVITGDTVIHEFDCLTDAEKEYRSIIKTCYDMVYKVALKWGSTVLHDYERG